MRAEKVTPTKTLILLPGLDGTEIFFGPLLAVLPRWVEPVVVTYPASGANDYLDLLAGVVAAIENSDCKVFYVLGCPSLGRWHSCLPPRIRLGF